MAGKEPFGIGQVLHYLGIPWRLFSLLVKISGRRLVLVCRLMRQSRADWLGNLGNVSIEDCDHLLHRPRALARL